MSGAFVAIVVALATIVTLLKKALPLFIFGGRKIPRAFEKWLSFIPAAVLAAFALPAMLIPEGTSRIDIGTANPYFIAGCCSLAVAVWRRSFFSAIVVGMATVALIRYLLS